MAQRSPSARGPIWSDGEVNVDQAAQWIDGDVPANGLRELAAGFLKRFKT